MTWVSWLHLSDWHQKVDDPNRAVVCDKLLRDIERRAEIHPDLASLDFVFFTGDLAFSGKPTEYKAAQEQFLDPLMQRVNVCKERLYLIPGNHDINRDRLKSFSDDVLKLPSDFEGYQKKFHDEDWRGDTLSAFRAYDAWVREYRPGFFGAWGSKAVETVQGKKVAIVGVNSALLCGRKKVEDEVHDKGNLAISEAQYARLLSEVADADLRIALVHHPFGWLHYHEETGAADEFHKSCHFILRGHEHVQNASVDYRLDGSSVTLAAGACYDGRIPERPLYAGAYNYVRYNVETGQAFMYLRYWEDRNRDWQADLRTKKAKNGVYTIAQPVVAQQAKQASRIPRKSKSSVSQAKADAEAEQAAQITALRARYLNYVANQWERLEMHGIRAGGNDCALPLDDIYVSLTIRRDAQRDWLEELSPRFQKKPDSLPFGGAPDEPGFLPERVLTKASVEAKEAEDEEEAIGLGQALQKYPRLVLLGDPGAGKTTLTRFLTRYYALATRDSKPNVIYAPPPHPFAVPDAPAPPTEDYGPTRMPILLRVFDLAKDDKDLPVYPPGPFLAQAVKLVGLTTNEAAMLFDDQISRGQALLVFDGLDEVVDEGIRKAIADKIKALCAALPEGNLVLATSRIVGYNQIRFNAPFEQGTLGDMEPEQVERFVGRRMLAYAKDAQPHMSSRELRAQAEPEADAILHAVNNNEGVKKLAVNPLLCGALCLLYRTVKELPQRRVKLYKLASQALLEDWITAKGMKVKPIVEEEEAEALLAPLANYMHETPDSNVIDRETLREQLRTFYAAHYNTTDMHLGTRQAVKDFTRRLCHDSGLLVERGMDKFAFLHLSFQEYWAARFLVNDFSTAPALIRERRHQPRYAEVIRLAIASQTRQNAVRLLRAAVWCEPQHAASSGYVASPGESYLHRDLRLAALCLHDCPDADPEYTRAVADKLTDILLREASPIPLITRAADIVPALLSRPAGEAAYRRFISDADPTTFAYNGTRERVLKNTTIISADRAVYLARNISDSDVVYEAVAHALRQAAASQPSIAQALLPLLKDKSNTVRQTVADVLDNAGYPQVIQALLPLLKDRIAPVRFMATFALSQAIDNLDVVHALLSLLRDRSSAVRRAAANVLGNVTDNPDVAQALLPLLKDKSNTVRQAASSALSQAVDNPDVVHALLPLLRDTDLIVRQAASGVLSRAIDNPDVVHALLSLLKDADEDVRRITAFSFRRAAANHTNIAQALLPLLKDKSNTVRQAASSALSQAVDNPDVVHALLPLLRDRSSAVRRAAANVLGNVTDNPDVVQALLPLLEDANEDVRRVTAFALVQAADNPDVVHALLSLLKDKSSFVRRVTAFAFVQAADNPDVVQALLSLLKDADEDVRRAAMASLIELAPMHSEIKEVLLASIGSANDVLRNIAWEWLDNNITDLSPEEQAILP